MAPSEPAPDIEFPSSTSTVTVRIIDSTTTLRLDPELFWRPAIKGLQPVQSPIYCFLISHGDQHILFDLGVRRDWENYAPTTAALIKSTTTVKTQQNVSEILDSDQSSINIRSMDISAVIWSHHHFDHIGDPSTFPSSTRLVVGPNFEKLYQPAYPTNPSSLLRDSDTYGRSIEEIKFQDDLHVGGFAAVDYFHDGSFYILDAPGHSHGHLCALARVTTSPDTFVFMGADAAHHPGIIRPTPYLPLPRRAAGCSGEALQAIHPLRSVNAPFFKPSERMFPAMKEAEETVRKIMEMDAQENVFVVLAHDASLAGEMDTFPDEIADWKEKGVKERTRWLFLKYLEKTMKV
ncbi:MAG: hypothetical protein Q9228_002319 [Teloschistes exilis]